MEDTAGTLVDIGDTSLFVVEKGEGPPLLVFHGGPGMDHTMFGDYLDPLASDLRLILVDERAQGRSDRAATEDTWTLEQMAKDVRLLAEAMGLERYAVLGHSYGAFVVLQNAVDDPGAPAATIVSSGAPSVRFLEWVEKNLAEFEPVDLHEQVAASWEREQSVRTHEDVVSLLADQMPFHFADPHDPRIPEYEKRTLGGVMAPDILRRFSQAGYGGIEVEERLDSVTQPVLVLAGRHDRTCSVEAAETIAKGIPNSELHVFEESGHMTYVEENEEYLAVVSDFLGRHLA